MTAADDSRLVPPTSSRTSAKAGRRLDIQGLRAVAVLMVVAFHAGLPVPGGFVGVDVFFVISGFVITAMLMREWQTHGRIRLGRFYVRRFKRLTPALALTVAVTMVLSVFILSPLGTQQDTSRTAIGAMLLAANLVIARLTGNYFDLEAETNALLNTWSLSVEEQFYLVFPLLLFAGWTLTRKLRNRNIGAISMVAGLGVVSFGLALLGASGYVLPREAWLLGFYSPVTRAWEFAVGALLALVGARLVIRSHSVAALLGAIGAALLGLSLFLLGGTTTFPGPATLLPVAGTMLLLIAGSVRGGIAERILSTPPMVKVGDWSYSLYLWHWPLIVFASLLWPNTALAAPVAAAVSFFPALASYYWIEMPLRTQATPRPRQLITLAAVVVLPPLMLAGGLWQASERGFWNPQVQQFQSAVFAYPDARCSRFEALSDANAGECTWNADASGKPVYLFGDSNAGHFADAVVEAGRQLDRPVLITTTNACPFLDLYIDRLDVPESRDATCRDFVQGTLGHLRTGAEPGTVIISNIDTYWDDGGYAIGASPESMTVTSAGKTAALDFGLATMIETLREAGHEVIVVQTIPRWSQEDSWKTASCNVKRIAQDGCQQSMPVERALERQGEARGAIDAVARRTDTPIYDPWNTLCTDGICSTNTPQGDPRYYRDGIHVSVDQGKALATDFHALLAAS